jgi:uncharacterized protein (TIGR02996 family)
MMKDADFLRTILDLPDDDVCRLAYADWLQERGDPASALRGEFVQVQIQLARRADPDAGPAAWLDSARVPELKAREQALLAAHGKEWAGLVAGLVDRYEYRRGFIEFVSLDATRFATHAEKLFALAPLRRVRLINALSKQVADCPHLARLTGLDFSKSQIGDHNLRILLASPHLGNVTWLDLSYCYLTDRIMDEFARSPLLGQLTYLNLSYNHLGRAGAQALINSPHWEKVKQLYLTGNYAIDNRLQQFLAQRLQGTADPALLRSMLQTESRQQREYTNADVRDLARRAGRDPARAADTLAEGLHHGNRKVRSAAATMLAQLGVAGTSALPKLVQRLYEQNDLTRDHVAPALARLLPELHPEMQRWLCLLANPLTSAPSNLRDALASAQLPQAVRERFAAVCARRLLWWKHVAGKGEGPAPVPKEGSYRTDVPGVRQMTNELLDRAGKHAGRDCQGKRKDQQLANGTIKEAAWLLARLTELLQQTLPAPVPAPAAAPRKERAQKK